MRKLWLTEDDISGVQFATVACIAVYQFSPSNQSIGLTLLGQIKHSHKHTFLKLGAKNTLYVSTGNCGNTNLHASIDSVSSRNWTC
jgi:hypothetical protein